MYPSFHTYYLKKCSYLTKYTYVATNLSFGMREIKVTLLSFTLKSWAMVIILDGRNFHILRYEEVILAYTLFNLNFMLIKSISMAY